MTRAYHKATFATSSLVVPDGTALATELPGYLSAQQIAQLELPGLPREKKNVIAKANRDGWRWIGRTGRGGGRLYATADLPAAARQALIDRRVSALSEAAAPVGRPKGTDWFTQNPDMAAAVEVIVAQRRLAVPRILELLAADFPVLPSRRTLQRYVAKLEQEKRALIASLRDPEAYRGRHRLALGRADGNVSAANEVWELDTTVADVMTAGGRKMILGMIDRWSRRAAFMVAESESGQSVRRFLVETIRRWGVMPQAVMTDNGAGYINASIRSALETLGIEHRICPPGSPEKKPHIERLFGTFTRERAELLDGYAGHNVADATALRAKAKKDTGRAIILATMTPAHLQEVLTNWVDGVYAHREHSSIRMSPMQKWMNSPAPSRAAPSEDVLRLALSALVGPRRVTKRGIVWKNGRYWAPALAGWMDREVIVRRDEDELGELFIFNPEGEYIDTAVNNERLGLSEEAFARLCREQQDAFMREARAEHRQKARRFDISRARDEILRRDAEAAGKLVSLPVPTHHHSTPTIDSLINREAPAPQPIASAPRLDTATILPMPVSPEQKMREADEIIARDERGETVDADRLRRARIYVTTSEYRTQRMMAEHFGPSVAAPGRAG